MISNSVRFSNSHYGTRIMRPSIRSTIKLSSLKCTTVKSPKYSCQAFNSTCWLSVIGFPTGNSRGIPMVLECGQRRCCRGNGQETSTPLANIKAVMTDTSIAFDTGDDDGTSYGFQLQHVYAIDFPERGFTFVLRAVIPILGLEPGTKTRITGEDGNPIPSDSGSVWGLGDSFLQFFSHRTPKVSGNGVLALNSLCQRIRTAISKAQSGGG